MNTSHFFKQLCTAALLCGFAAFAQAAITDISDTPLGTAGVITAKPNVMFMLDDSGSMDWDYMPDDAKSFAGKYGFNSNHCNGVYYDPHTIYSPPVDSTGTSYPNASFSAAWKDGYNTGAGTVNLSTGFTGGSGTGSSGAASYTGPAFYYTYSGTQTSSAQMDFHNTASTFYKECNSAVGSTTAVDGTHPVNTLFQQVALIATAPITTISISGGPVGGATGATITVSGTSKATVSHIKVNGAEILKGTTRSSSKSTSVANNIASGINACTSSTSGNCTVTGYSATVSGSVVTITGPGDGYTPVITCGTCGMTFTATVFPTISSTKVSSITVNGTQLLSATTAAATTPAALATAIGAKISATGYSATVSGSVVTITGPTSSANFTPVITPCLGVTPFTCYAPPATPPSSLLTLATGPFPGSNSADLQNFANWYSYYSTRMLMMKTGVGQAFAPLTDKYRIGFMTMNNNVSPDIVDISDFNATQKGYWYTKLYASSPGNSTPLREALSHVGQLYAHKFGDITTYTATVTVKCSNGTAGSGTTGDCGVGDDTGVESVTVHNVETMDCALPSNSNPCPQSQFTKDMATQIGAQINAMVTTDYGASVSGNVITISGPAWALGYTPVISDDGGGMTFTSTAFTSHTTTAQLNGITPLDPMQYSCQQNFVILSTDGYWNGSTTYDLANSPVGNRDGTEVRPMLDGSLSTTTIVTPYTTVQRRQTVTPTTTTTNWSKTTSSIGASCTVSPLVTPVNLQTTVPLSDTNSSSNFKINVGLFSSASAPIGPNACIKLSSTGATTAAWICRGTAGSTAGTLTGSAASITDSAGITWYLVSNTNGNTGCITDPTAFGTGYSASKGACPNKPAVTGNTVTSTPYSQTETIVGSNSSLDDYTASQSSTQLIVNGAAGTVGALTPATLTYSLLRNVSTVTNSPTSDVLGLWNAGTTTNVCTATASLPTAGTTSPIAGTPSVANGTPVTAIISTTGPTAGTPTSSTVSTGGTSNTLADVAEYYYMTDLRDNSLANCSGTPVSGVTNDVCTDNVPTSNLDKATWQHMTTFTLGLGARGRMAYSPTYQTDISGDFFSVKTGAMANGTICSWQVAPYTACTWPIPSSGAIENIDDLWHAALDGRGEYLSATDPNSLKTGLTAALGGIASRLGSAAAASASNPNVSSNDNYMFSSSYTSVDWIGELTRQQIDLNTGAISATVDWSAQTALDGLAAAGSRNIYTYNPTATTYTGDSATLNSGFLKTFTYNNLTGTEQSYFSNISGLTQYSGLSSTQQTAAAGANLVNYLRGVRSNEATLYRVRQRILGDIVDSGATYVRAPLFSYGDSGYAAFVTAKATRRGIVYAGSNDGMLHAFYAADGSPGAGGDEAWAYIPTMVLPNLYQLADTNYSVQHRYFVDATPVASDICPNAPSSSCTASQWKTILVGGLGKGGSGYYALDVTDPYNPQALWEFTDANMGYTFGNPQITKLADGTWVVLLTSGYDNVPSPNGPKATGDGVGRLYVLNANTGALIRTISTGVGTVGTPSGLAHISARVLAPTTDNSALEVYGGDMLGNLWRFDINNNVGAASPAYDAQLLATLKDTSGTVQPITTKPEIGSISSQLVIFVGTGSFMGNSDLTNTQLQTMYAIKDPLASTTTPGIAIYNNPRSATCASASASNCFVQQTATNTTCPNGSSSNICASGSAVRTATNYAVDFSSQSGWFINFPDSGERNNTNPVLALGTLGFTTNTPTTASACSVGGYSYRWFLDYRTGAPLIASTTGVISTRLGDVFANSPVYIHLPNNTVVEETATSGGKMVTSTVPVSATSGGTRRTSWRELIQQ